MERPSNSIAPGRPESLWPRGRTGAEGLVEDLTSARRELLAARHDAYHRLLGLLIAVVSGPNADDTLSSSFARVWRTRSFPTFYERPLPILAALRADALEEGPPHPLHAALAATTPDPNVVTTEAVLTSLERERLGVWAAMTSRRVQTNETSRAVAWLWPAFLAGCDGGRRTLALVDIGAGAGLNLIADHPASYRGRYRRRRRGRAAASSCNPRAIGASDGDGVDGARLL